MNSRLQQLVRVKNIEDSSENSGSVKLFSLGLPHIPFAVAETDEITN